MLRVESCSTARVWRHAHGKNADSLDVAALRVLKRSKIGHDLSNLRVKSCDSASRLRLHIQKIAKDDRYGLPRLSKIAHNAEIKARRSSLEDS
jgi:hypothetical protein